MKRTWFIAVTIGIAVLTGCGKASGNGEKATGSDTVQAANAEQSDAADGEKEQPAKTEENNPTAYPPCVMVGGIVYQDTGFHSSMIGCGTMDGKITSAVDSTELPSQDNQSNFGTGYDYQRSVENQIIVVIDGEQRIFRNIDSHDTSMPSGVKNFRAEVKEICEDGKLLVTYISTADGFLEMPEGDYYAATENLMDEVKVGHQVTIWFNGNVEETAPAQLGEVYRVEKTEQ